MSKGSEHPDASRKKQVSELLRNADRLLKSGEYDAALTEVEKSLELEPGNFYAQAYKERIAVLKEKHRQPSLTPTAASPAAKSGTRRTAGDKPRPETPAESPPEETTESATEITGTTDSTVNDLRQQLARARATEEDETQRRAEEVARKALEDEIRQREQEEKRKKLEESALADAVSAARIQAKSDLVTKHLTAARKKIEQQNPDAAFLELAKVRVLEPSHAEIQPLLRQIDALLPGTLGDRFPKKTEISRETVVALYSRILKIGWMEGVPNKKQHDILTAARSRLAITPEEGKGLLAGIQKEIYSTAFTQIYEAGEPDEEQKQWLNRLAAELAVDEAEITRLKESIRK